MTSSYLHKPEVHSGAPFSASRPLVFAINGVRIVLSSIDPSMTLLDYLRYHTQFTGTKFGCGEGGCGACVVHLSKYDVHNKQIHEFGINACLALVCSLDGCAITTTEGLGSTKAGFHAVHRRLAGFNGSQCGFCSPGMCMSIYTGLRRSQKQKTLTLQSTSRDIQTSLYTLPQLKMADAEKMIVGNICRCTGYRPILDACKSFAGDVDMEDLGLNAFWPPGKRADAHLLPPYNPISDPSFPEFLIEELEARFSHEQSVRSRRLQGPSLQFRYVDGTPQGGEKFWVTPSALEGVFEALKAMNGRGEVKLVVGNTTAGIYKDLKPKVFIDISRIPELLTLRETEHGLEVGAAVAIETLIDHLEAMVALSSHGQRTDDHSIFHGILSHLKLVGNPHVRSRASVGGNLIIAQKYSFASDIATLFLGAGVTLKCIASARNQITFTMEEFLQKGSLEPEMLLQSIFIPKRPYVPQDNTKLVYKTYRAAPRQFGNALAYINAAFLAELVPASGPTERKGTHIVKKVILAFGAFGTKHAVRAKAVEDILVGNLITPTLLLTAIHVLNTKDVVPDPGTDDAEYRSSVAVGFFFKFFRPYLSEFSVVPTLRDEVMEELKKTEDNYVTSGKQQFVVSDEFFPVGKPTPKVSAEIQAAGEAIYVDDIPTPDSCLFAAFVYSKMAYAKIQHVDSTSALASAGVVSYVSADDIPGQNIGVQTPYGTENLFATELVECVGHPLGIVVADSSQHAKDAVEKVEVKYDSTIGSPILSMEDAVSRKSFFTIPETIVPQPVGNISTGFAEAEHKIEHAEVRTGGQYFFYMENNTALAIPDEDNCFLLYSSSQGPANLQKCISTCLGLPSNNIRIITRRAGGGFGGKLFRSITVAAACAVAAYKVRRPVRMYLDRNTDAIMMGGRHPVKAVYSVGFKSTGEVTALQINIFIDAGWSPDMSTALPYYMIKGLKKYNWNALDVKFTVCKTNLASKSSMRAPGVAQGSFIADTILEHVAASLGLDVHTVYEKNIHTLESAATFYSGVDLQGPQGYPLPALWREMKNRMSTRADSIQDFNHRNRWLKRGLGISPCTYELETHPQPGRVSILSDGSVVVEVGGVEIGQGLWTKVMLTTLFGLHQLWQNDSNIKFPSVRVVQADSISLVNGGFTFESTTSEGSCEAVRKACEMLVERLMPTKMELEKKVGPGKVTWLNLITTALTAEIDLSAQIRWPSLEKTWKYLSCGVAAAEVQIDVITGELVILRVDIIFDSGKSINPAIDIGQVEGAFMQGVGFLMTEEYKVDENGKVVSDGTWNYKPPTLDNTPQQFNVQLLNGVTNQNRILSSKASGEPPLLMAKCVHTATRQAIESARKDLQNMSTSQRHKESEFLTLNAPTTFHKVKAVCGFNNVEQYLEFLVRSEKV